MEPRLLALAVVLACVVAAGAIAAWATVARADGPRVELVCGECGHLAQLPSEAIVRPCPKCGRGWMFAPIRCSTCQRHFPLKLHTTRDGRCWAESCPRCRTLDHAELPTDVQALLSAPPPAQEPRAKP